MKEKTLEETTKQSIEQIAKNLTQYALQVGTYWTVGL